MQAVQDLAGRPLRELRILDLASAHGLYSLELGLQGAQVVGLEAREHWVNYAVSQRDALGLANVEFVREDVRNLRKAVHGQFDVVLCLGILYHLDAPDIFDFLAQVFDVCRHFVVIETHIALEPSVSREWRGQSYWGWISREHPEGATPEAKIMNVGASIDNDESFWLTQASLCNVLRHVGFTSVYDCRNPVANLFVGAEHAVKIWNNRVTLIAMKGQPLHLRLTPSMEPEADWPERLGEHAFTPREIGFDAGADAMVVANDTDDVD